MNFNDQNTPNSKVHLNNNTTGGLNNNNLNNNNNTAFNPFSINSANKNNMDYKNSQNIASANNFFEIDFNESEILGGYNNHFMGNMMGGANHHQQQNNFFLEGPVGGCGTTSTAGQGHVYYAPMKYGYLGQQEEQIFHDKQMNNIQDFEFGSQFFNGSHQNPFTLNPVNSLNNAQGNGNGNQNNSNTNNNANFNGNSSMNLGNNPNGLFTNNFLFSTYNANNAVDLADLFPSEPVPKLENKQPSHGNNFYMENVNDFSLGEQNGNSDNNHNSQILIVPKSECIQNNCNNDCQVNNKPMEQNNFIFNTNINSNGSYMINEKSNIHMKIPYGGNQILPNQQSSFNILNDQANLTYHKSQPLMNQYNLGNQTINPKVNNSSQISSLNQGNKNNVFSIIKDQQKDKKKDYDKNICRYITRQVVRSFSSPEFKTNVLCIISDIYPEANSQNILLMYKEVTEYFLGEIENLSGFRALKDILVINPEADGELIASQKLIFRDFMKWFLKERYFRNIISGNMKDKLAFIRYKNKIMLHYINKPTKWNSNKKKNGKNSSPMNNSSNGIGNCPFSSNNISKQEY